MSGVVIVAPTIAMAAWPAVATAASAVLVAMGFVAVDETVRTIGDSHPKAELEELGRTLAGRVIQQYVYARVVEEMKNRTGMELVEQTVDDEDNIRIKLRSWEE